MQYSSEGGNIVYDVEDRRGERLSDVMLDDDELRITKLEKDNTGMKEEINMLKLDRDRMREQITRIIGAL